jgi:reactive intermediate/imine deaminase
MIRSWIFTPAEGVPPPVGPFSHATAAGETLYVTGQMPTGLDGTLIAGGIAEQTDRVLANLARVLQLLGGSLKDVAATRAYLRDWADYEIFNSTYERWFPERMPARTCVGASGLAASASVEVDLTAWRPQGWASARDRA